MPTRRRVLFGFVALATLPCCTAPDDSRSASISDTSDASEVSRPSKASDASTASTAPNPSTGSTRSTSSTAARPDAAGAAAPDDSGATSSSAALASLSVSPLQLSPSFSPDIHDYTVACAAGTNALQLSWATRGSASVSLVVPVKGDASAPRSATPLDGAGQSATAAKGSLPRDAGAADASQWETRTVSYGSSAKDVTVELAEDQAATLRVDGAEYWVRCLPHDFPTITATEKADAGARGDGFYLLGTAIAPPGSASFAMVLDVHGTPVWYLRVAQTVFDVDLAAPNVISFLTAAAPAGFGTDPNARWELRDLASGKSTYVKAVGGPTDLHEFRTLANGDYLVQSYDIVTGVDLTGLEKFGPNSTVADCVLEELDRTGALVWSWRASDHIDMVRESTIPESAAVNGQTVIDPIHVNSVDEAANGDLLVSARHLDAVFLVSKATGKIVWKLGGAAYSRDGAQLLQLKGDTGFFRQHDARLVSKDTISLFDDESLMKASARAVAYSIDLTSGTATRVWQDIGSTSSIAMGSARVLPNDDVVVGWGLPSTGYSAVTEFDKSGHDLFEIEFPSGEPSYRAVKVPPASFDLDVLRRAVGE